MCLVCNELTGSRQCSAGDPQKKEMAIFIMQRATENCEGVVDSIMGPHGLTA